MGKVNDLDAAVGRAFHRALTQFRALASRI